jgi:DNA-binding GntR family transcriptional regulator
MADGSVAKRTTTRADELYDTLLRKIADQELVAGQSLVISHLAETYGMSPIPIREALSRLRENNLVEYRPMQGFRVVPPLDASEVHDLFTARLEIEVASAKYAAAAITTDKIEAMKRANDAIKHMKFGVRYRDYKTFIHLNAEFHSCMVSATGNRFLQRAYKVLGYEAQSARILHGIGLPDRDQICQEHDEIINALSRRDAEAAVTMVRAHIEHGYERLFETDPNSPS